MPIADCGFPGTDQMSGAAALIQYGPTLWVDIGFDPEYKYDENSASPRSEITQVPALVDTGATISCIDDALAQSLNLPLVDRQMSSGIGGKHELNVYLAHIVVPALSFFQYGIFHGVSLTEGEQPHRALIGRTFLQGMMLIYDGRTGSVQIAR